MPNKSVVNQYVFLEDWTIVLKPAGSIFIPEGTIVWGFFELPKPIRPASVKINYAGAWYRVPAFVVQKTGGLDSASGIDAARGEMITPLGSPFEGRLHEDTLMYGDMFINATGSYTLNSDWSGKDSAGTDVKLKKGEIVSGEEGNGVVNVTDVTKNILGAAIPLSYLKPGGGGGSGDGKNAIDIWLDRIGKGVGIATDTVKLIKDTNGVEPGRPGYIPTKKKEGMSATTWVLIGGGVLAVVGTVIYFATRKPTA